MSYLRLFLSLFAILLLAVPSFAQEDEERWRDFEVSIFGGLSSPGGDMTDWNDSLGAKSGFHSGFSVGYYLNGKLCTGLYFNYSRWSAEGDFDRNFHNYDFGTYLKYAIVNESNFEPYFKLSGGFVWPKYPTWETENFNILREQSYDPGYGIAGYAGMLWYTSDYGSLFFELGYHQDFLDGVEARNHGQTFLIENNSQYFEITVGVTVFFGPEE